MTESWKYTIYSRKNIAIVSLDLSGAFDNVFHDQKKLSAYGMESSALQLIRSYLHERRSCNRLSGNYIIDGKYAKN